MKYSIIVPVFNRPDEVDELLESLVNQEEKDFEVIIVEDGSQIPCEDVCRKYADQLTLRYFMKPNSGPGQSRNYGAERAEGEYLLILDSDVVLPNGYLKAVSDELDREPADAFGEDIDFSIRIFKAGKRCRLFPEAWVWHKRRTDFRKFWRQVYNSGIARVNLYKKYPESLKLVHLLPMVFTLGVALLLVISLVGLVLANWWLAATPLLLLFAYYYLNVCYSWYYFHNFKANILSGIAAYVQLTGYGCGFIEAWWKRCVRKQDEFTAYEKNFYK